MILKKGKYQEEKRFLQHQKKQKQIHKRTNGVKKKMKMYLPIGRTEHRQL